MSNKNKIVKKTNPNQDNSKKGLIIALVIIAVVAVVAIAAFAAGLKNSPTSGNANDGIQSSETEVGEMDTCVAKIDIEGYGVITLELDKTAAPITVDNFVKLAKEGFYDGLTFHRIMEGFMMQGGDPDGNGTGGSDENIKGEFASNGVDNPISHKRGVISMARSQDPNSASSQFFICHEDATFLDGEYAAFGHVTDGIDIVDRVCSDSNPIDSNGTILPEEQPVIKSITIE